MTKIGDIILWVPGTNNHSRPQAFVRAAKQPVQLVDYEASWRFSSSLVDGYDRLVEALLAAQRKRKPGQRILLAGESQGALLISKVLMNPRYAAVVDKAVLLGHPGISPIHYKYPDAGVLEINHVLDPATFHWTDHPTALIEAIDKISRLNLKSFSTLPIFARVFLDHPFESVWAGVLALGHLHPLSRLIPNPHDYSRNMAQAARWLVSTEAP